MPAVRARNENATSSAAYNVTAIYFRLLRAIGKVMRAARQRLELFSPFTS